MANLLQEDIRSIAHRGLVSLTNYWIQRLVPGVARIQISKGGYYYILHPLDWIVSLRSSVEIRAAGTSHRTAYLQNCVLTHTFDRETRFSKIKLTLNKLPSDLSY